MSYPIEVKKVENVTLSKDFVDLRKNIKYKESKIQNNIKQNRLLRKQTRRIETIQNLKQRFKKGVQLVGVSLVIILIISHNFNFKFDIAQAQDINIEETILNSALEQEDYTEQDIEQIINKIDNQKYGKSISDEEYEKQVKAKEEEIRIYNEEVERVRIERNKEVQKQEIKKVEKPVVVKKESILVKTEDVKKEDNLDLNKLAYAVSMAETSGFTKGYGVSHLNGQGIKHGNTAPCPGVAKLKMCKFKTKQESDEAFKKIWSTWYKEFPTLQMAKRWTGDDKAELWLEDVKYYYYNEKI